LTVDERFRIAELDFEWNGSRLKRFGGRGQSLTINLPEAEIPN